jgi:hypothetical protein
MQRNNKYNKKHNKRNKIVIKYKTRRTTYLSSTMHQYIITERVVLDATHYQQQNLRISMQETLLGNPMFLQVRKQYQYVKFISVMLRFTPILQGANDPPSGFVVFLGNEDLMSINYTDLPYLSYKRYINPKKVSRYVFTRPGRQPDFNYWYNTGNINSTDAWFKIRLDQAFNIDSGYYTLDMGFRMIFDKPIYESDSNKLKSEKEEKIIMRTAPEVDDKHLAEEELKEYQDLA